jgi:hypothetical protein
MSEREGENVKLKKVRERNLTISYLMFYIKEAYCCPIKKIFFNRVFRNDFLKLFDARASNVHTRTPCFF